MALPDSRKEPEMTEHTLWIRPMTEADLDQMAAMEQEIFSDPWSRKICQNIWEQKQYSLWALAEKEPGENTERLAGYLCAMTVLEEEELHRVAVSPRLRGQGWGQKLMTAFLQDAREKGIATIYLEVRAGNIPAIGLYEKNGFTSVGLRKGYYQNPKEDARIMQKILPLPL
jgi:ribosomal-protein-alanine N-acetyltransferase